MIMTHGRTDPEPTCTERVTQRLCADKDQMHTVRHINFKGLPLIPTALHMRLGQRLAPREA